ncbi:MAG TPA: hypothetical protein ENK94_02765 [Campylobacterales bacterium]|nr:hypothetical protein [Campylobacterales bacterium]
MKQSMVMEKYPISEMDIMKSETTFVTVDEVIAYLKEKIDVHPVAGYIATFDHCSHTKSLGDAGEISPDILDAKNIICCFGKQLPSPTLLAVRPRSIGVAEMADRFVVSFLDAPNAQAHDVMVSWVKGIVNK